MSLPGTGLEAAAASILQRGVDLDNKKRFTESTICYQEGTQLLLDMLKIETSVEKRTYLRTKVQGYLDRIEKLKKFVEDEKTAGSYHEQILIESGSTGHSYKNVFSRFLDSDVIRVEVEDPYIRSFHQCQNFLRFCELLVLSCTNLKTVTLLTSSDNSVNEQMQSLQSIKQNLLKYNIELSINVSPTLHDRQIILSNGWIVKIGRGLDYFKPPVGKFTLGVFDLDLRQCHETTINVFHAKDVRQSYG